MSHSFPSRVNWLPPPDFPPVVRVVRGKPRAFSAFFKIFRAFQLVDNKDENIVNYLNLILDDYVNYLSKESFRQLVKRVKELEKLDIIDAQNILCLNQSESYLVVNDVETNDDSHLNFKQQEELNVGFDSCE